MTLRTVAWCDSINPSNVSRVVYLWTWAECVEELQYVVCNSLTVKAVFVFSL